MLRNVASNWVLTLISIISAYLLLPYTVSILGREQYGIWLLIAAATGYLRLLTIGAPMTSVRYVARAAAAKNTQELNEVVGTFLGLYLIMGAISLVIGAGLYVFLPQHIDIDPASIPLTRLCLILVVLNISIGFVQQLPFGILAGYQDFMSRNAILVCSSLLRLGGTLLGLKLYPSILTLPIVQSILLAMEFTISYCVIRKKYPDIRMRLSNFRPDLLKGVLSFSIYVTLLQVGAQLSFETDSLVIGTMIGVADVPYFAVANSLILYFMEFLIAIAAVVMPRATELHQKDDMPQLRQVFLQWSKISYLITLIGGLYLLIIGSRFVGWWMGPEFERPSGIILSILVGSYFIYLPLRAVAQPILMGVGKPRAPTVAFIVTGILNLILSMALAKPFGLGGVAWGTAIPNVIFALFLLQLTCKELNQPVGEFLHYVFPKATLAAVPVAAFLYFCRTNLELSSFLSLAVSGIASAVLMVMLIFVYVYRNDPLMPVAPSDVRKIIARLRRR